MKILNLYYSETGNTEKIALQIENTVNQLGHLITTSKATSDQEIALLDYDFIFLGSGVYMWQPAKPMIDFLHNARKHFAALGNILPCSPRLPGKKAVIYCTFGGGHTGINEAMPVVKFCGQLFDHLGFTILDEWYIVGEFKTDDFKKMNIGGRLGDITGRPDERDLNEITQRVRGILHV